VPKKELGKPVKMEDRENKKQGKKRTVQNETEDMKNVKLKDGAEKEEMEEDENDNFEDPYEDEYEDEDENFKEEIVSDHEEEGMEMDQKDYVEVNEPVWVDEEETKEKKQVILLSPTHSLNLSKKQVWLPGNKLNPGEVLECDMTAYEMLHPMKVEWPCLSFDILPDKLGVQRTKVSYLATIFKPHSSH
jgi:ribosome assembly protein RRB1